MDSIITFGKYKGQNCSVLANDQQYCNWLCGQDWFRNKYSNIYNIIVNNILVSEDTPEHNRMQALFLDDNFLNKIQSIIFPFERIVKKAIEEEMAEKRIIESNRVNPFFQRQYGSRNEESYKIAIQQWEDHHNALLQTISQTNANSYIVERNIEFEEYGWDVLMRFETYKHFYSLPHVFFELKPSIGDDYPSVLREMKRHREKLKNGYHGSTQIFLLIYDNFTSEGISEIGMVEIFKKSDIIALPLKKIMQKEV